jgi:hypothetical protein
MAEQTDIGAYTSEKGKGKAKQTKQAKNQPLHL